MYRHLVDRRETAIRSIRITRKMFYSLSKSRSRTKSTIHLTVVHIRFTHMLTRSSAVAVIADRTAYDVRYTGKLSNYQISCLFLYLQSYSRSSREVADFKFGTCIQRGHPNKSPLKILEKRERGRIQGLPNFLGAPIISGTGKAAHFKFRSTFAESIGRKVH